MSSSVSIHKLGKQYRIGGLHPGYVTFREMLAGAFATALKRSYGSEQTTIWALKDIDLEIEPGELIGIIGRNGAGKSTLLKILSRITRPTVGGVTLHGRVGSLLEVGTGFHPDLTGRENVYLSGAILGMSRTEIDRKFDEIVDFSEIETFINTPVKWYSSGMYVRLAFSVAAHLEPEILMMDEVLAVGDAAFQQKCLAKMRDIRRHGRTILFVSHNMSAITRLCRRAILLDKGRIISDGPAKDVVNKYLSLNWNIPPQREWPNPSEAPGDDTVLLRHVRVKSEEGRITNMVDSSEGLGIEIGFDVLSDTQCVSAGIELVTEDGTHLFTSSHETMRRRSKGVSNVTAWIPAGLLSEGMFRVNVMIFSEGPPAVRHAYVENAVSFQVFDGNAPTEATLAKPGLLRPTLNWTD